MGYQGGNRYGRGANYRGDHDERYRQRDYRDDWSRRSPPQGYDYDDRGFFDRAGDEVRSWFGDEEAERRREYDDYYNRRYGDPRDQSSRLGFTSSGYRPGRGYGPYREQSDGFAQSDVAWNRSYDGPTEAGYGYDSNYQSWRDERLAELDRDYAEYQRENRQRFDNEFGTWRNRRTTQRQSLGQAQEHMDVVGSDGAHVGTVDKIAGDRIILTKGDRDAGGRHHSIPSRWIDRVEGQTVVLEKTADQAKEEWRLEEERQALFGGDRDRQADSYGTRVRTRYSTYR